MQDLFNKTKELEDLALNLNNVVNEYSKIIMKIEEIHFLQLKIETKLEMDAELKNEYNKWKEEKLNLIFWFIRLGKYIANLKKQNITLSESENTSLKNLIQFLTKYNYICKQNTDDKIKEKIEMQINNLFQNIFKTDKKLIKEKNLVTKIIPYFEYNPNNIAILNTPNDDNDKTIITKPEINESSNIDSHNYFKDSFMINLNTKLYIDEDLDVSTCCYYDVSIPRKVYALLVRVDNLNKVVLNEEELNALGDYEIIGVEGLCEEVVEGWYKKEDIKFI